jgi:hypothetical protein
MDEKPRLLDLRALLNGILATKFHYLIILVILAGIAGWIMQSVP